MKPEQKSLTAEKAKTYHTMTLRNENLSAAISALEAVDFNALYTERFGRTPEDADDDQATEQHPVLFDLVEKDIYFFPEMDFLAAHLQQNACVRIGAVSASDIIMGDPAGEIIDSLLHAAEEADAMDKAMQA